jgi:hypothetical protein
VTEWFERDGRLADGTPLRDVAAETPVEAREPGTLDWHTGVVISVGADEGFGPPLEVIRVELEGGKAEGTYHTNYVRRRKLV